MKSRSSSPGRGGRKLALPLLELVVLLLAEQGAGGLDLLVLEEPVDQDLPGVLLLGQVLLPGEEHLGLDVDQEGCDEQELGLPVQVDLLLPVEVTPGNPG